MTKHEQEMLAQKIVDALDLVGDPNLDLADNMKRIILQVIYKEFDLYEARQK